MDLADASLVILAEQLGYGRIFSVDKLQPRLYSDTVNTFPIQAINATEVIQALEIYAKYNYVYLNAEQLSG